MSDILCIYYSRTGNTKKAMEEIAAALDAELAELRDNADRSGWRGWLRCGLDAMRKDTRPVAPLETARPLGDYRLVILGTPVWAGRSSAVMRSFLKDRGDPQRGLCADPQQRLPVPGGLSPDGSLCARRSSGGGVPAKRGRGLGILAGGVSPPSPGLSGGAVAADPFLKSTGEEMPHAGKTEGAGPAV